MRHVAALVVVVVVWLVGASAMAALAPQAAVQAFEAVSVKHNTIGPLSESQRWTPGLFSATNLRLEALVLQAFQIPSNIARYVVIGGSGGRPDANCTGTCASREEILSAHFDIRATVSGEVPTAERAALLKQLLADRFKLKAHFESREIPAYALTVADPRRLGPQLRRSEHNCEVWSRQRNAGGTALSGPEPLDSKGRPLCTTSVLGRIGEGIYTYRGAGEISLLVSLIRGDARFLIVDKTGLTGTFEWELTSEAPGFRDLVPNLAAQAPSLEDALQEQLGLRLVRTMSVVQVLIIDSVSMPEAN